LGDSETKALGLLGDSKSLASEKVAVFGIEKVPRPG